MDRRDFIQFTALALAGCGADAGDSEMNQEYLIQPSPPRTTRQIADLATQGVWTPSISFEVPGNLALSQVTAAGNYFRFGPVVFAWFAWNGFVTHTSASGTLWLTNFPFVARADTDIWPGVGMSDLEWGGISLQAGYTAAALRMQLNEQYAVVLQNGHATLSLRATAAPDVPTGNALELTGGIVYLARD